MKRKRKGREREEEMNVLFFAKGSNDFGQLGRMSSAPISSTPERALFALHLRSLEPRIAQVTGKSGGDFKFSHQTGNTGKSGGDFQFSNPQTGVVWGPSHARSH
jgi:hypothetical protein